MTIVFCFLLGTSLAIDPQLKNGIITGKKFYFILVSIVLTATFVFYQFKKGFFSRWDIDWVGVFIIARLIYVFLNILFTEEAFLSSLKFVELVFMTIAYFIGKSLISKGDFVQFNIIIITFLAFGFFQAFLGLEQLYGYEASHHSLYKVTGSFFNPAPFGGYLVSIFPIGLAMFHFLPKGKWNALLRYFGLLTALIILLVIPSTLSRASWIGLIIGTAVVYAYYFDVHQILKSNLKSRLSKLVIFISVIFLITSFGYGLFYWKKNSAMGRVLIWRVTFEIVKDNPIFGVGFNQYNPAYGKKQAEYFQLGKYDEEMAMVAGKGEYAFNELLHIVAEEGVIGLILLLGLIFSALQRPFLKCRELEVHENALVVGILGAVAALLAFSFFSYPFSCTPLLFNFYFFVSILSAHKRVWQFSLPKIVKCFISASVLIFCFWVIKIQKQKYSMQIEWKEASLLKSYGYYNESIEVMEKIKLGLETNGDFLFEYGQLLTLNKDYKEAIAVLERATCFTSDPHLYNSLGNSYKSLGKYKLAEQAYLHAFYLIPHKLYPRYLLAKLYEEIGDEKRAIETANQILNMKIKVDSKAIDKIRSEMKLLIESAKTSQEACNK